jgi:hypothetical protein
MERKKKNTKPNSQPTKYQKIKLKKNKRMIKKTLINLRLTCKTCNSSHDTKIISCKAKQKESQNLIFKQFNFEEWNLKNQLKKIKKNAIPNSQPT